MQVNQNFNISIIIIGFNTEKPLSQLLKSINTIQINQLIEVIYIDDGSIDSSYDLFNACQLKFSKKSYKINTNKGRAFATEKGISIAKGEWLYFIRSNEIILKNTLSEYFKVIHLKEVFAIMGVVKYQSKDKKFENYLNSNYRGISKYKNGTPVDYKYLLFNNSIIHQSIFKNIQINQALSNYGGEELEFSFRLNEQHPNKTLACPSAIVLRNNYPQLANHLNRLVEFGATNFKLLNLELKLKVISYKFLLFPKMKLFIKITNVLCKFLYKINFRYEKINYNIIRLRMLCAILKGYHSGS